MGLLYSILVITQANIDNQIKLEEKILHLYCTTVPAVLVTLVTYAIAANFPIYEYRMILFTTECQVSPSKYLINMEAI